MLHRIKEYIDSKGIKISTFERSIGMSNASFGKSLKSGGNIGSDKIENILRVYTDINPVWLTTGEGDMLRDEGIENIDIYREKYINQLEHENKRLLKEIADKDLLIEAFSSGKIIYSGQSTKIKK